MKGPGEGWWRRGESNLSPATNTGFRGVNLGRTRPAHSQAQSDTPQEVKASASRPNVSHPEHGLNTPETQEGHEKCADVCAGCAISSEKVDADLRRVNEAWADLPEAVKAGIVAMVKAARGAK